jgi:hypothetical protein
MKTSNQQIAGIALIAAAVLVATIIQLSGRGYIRTVTHPTPPPQYLANGITLGEIVHKHYSVTQSAMMVPALIGTFLLFVPKRRHVA